MTRIVDFVLVDDERADQSTELDQRMPVAAITGKTRRLDREHSADTAVADRCEQPLETGTCDATTQRPRSSSMTSTLLQPSCLARSTRPYWRRRLSRISRQACSRPSDRAANCVRAAQKSELATVIEVLLREIAAALAKASSGDSGDDQDHG